jgi:hypothetical protein
MLLLFYVSLNFELFNGNYWVFAVISLSSTAFIFMWPFHISYYYFRKGIMATFLKNLFPIGKNGVRFKDFVFGDILTSLVKPFTSFTLALCLLGCTSCQTSNERYQCNRSNNLALALTLSPYIIRFFQCINRWYYTKSAWPHAFNALKYLAALTNAYIGWLYNNKVVGDLVFIIVGLSAASYLLFWDYYMDWGLFREVDNKENKYLLRKKLMYPSRYYYTAMTVNFILRLIWFLNFVDLGMIDKVAESEIKNLFFSVLEVFRRIQWSLFRVENENCNNLEKYRTVLDMPVLPEELSKGKGKQIE